MSSVTASTELSSVRPLYCPIVIYLLTSSTETSLVSPEAVSLLFLSESDPDSAESVLSAVSCVSAVDFVSPLLSADVPQAVISSAVHNASTTRYVFFFISYSLHIKII